MLRSTMLQQTTTDPQYVTAQMERNTEHVRFQRMEPIAASKVFFQAVLLIPHNLQGRSMCLEKISTG